MAFDENYNVDDSSQLTFNVVVAFDDDYNVDDSPRLTFNLMVSFDDDYNVDDSPQLTLNVVVEFDDDYNVNASRQLTFSVAVAFDDNCNDSDLPFLPVLFLLVMISCRHALHMLWVHGSINGSAYSSKQTGQVSSSSISLKVKSLNWYVINGY